MRKQMVGVAVAIVAVTAGAVAGAPAAVRPSGADGAGAAARARPTLTVRPRVVRRGGSVMLYGGGFKPHVRVILLAGPPASEAARIGSAKTDGDGAFVAPVAIERDVAPGRYVALACRHDCRVKASASFRVLR
jgi:hypothetical protein